MAYLPSFDSLETRGLRGYAYTFTYMHTSSALQDFTIDSSFSQKYVVYVGYCFCTYFSVAIYTMHTNLQKVFPRLVVLKADDPENIKQTRGCYIVSAMKMAAELAAFILTSFVQSYYRIRLAKSFDHLAETTRPIYDVFRILESRFHFNRSAIVDVKCIRAPSVVERCRRRG